MSNKVLTFVIVKQCIYRKKERIAYLRVANLVVCMFDEGEMGREGCEPAVVG